MKLSKEDRKQLIELANSKNIYLEGNIIKLIDDDNDADFKEYLQQASIKDKDSRKKRLDMTKQVQSQNRDLISWKEENEKIQSELRLSLEQTEESMKEANLAKDEAERMKEEAERLRVDAEISKEEAIRAKREAEKAKDVALDDLNLLQKKTQNELIGIIVKVSLLVIIGVALITTAVYLIAIFTGKDTQVIASTWSNIIGILLTNAFSIIGTIMGIKYASDDKKKEA